MGREILEVVEAPQQEVQAPTAEPPQTPPHQVPNHQGSSTLHFSSKHAPREPWFLKKGAQKESEVNAAATQHPSKEVPNPGCAVEAHQVSEPSTSEPAALPDELCHHHPANGPAGARREALSWQNVLSVRAQDTEHRQLNSRPKKPGCDFSMPELVSPSASATSATTRGGPAAAPVPEEPVSALSDTYSPMENTARPVCGFLPEQPYQSHAPAAQPAPFLDCQPDNAPADERAGHPCLPPQPMSGLSNAISRNMRHPVARLELEPSAWGSQHRNSPTFQGPNHDGQESLSETSMISSMASPSGPLVPPGAAMPLLHAGAAWSSRSSESALRRSSSGSTPCCHLTLSPLGPRVPSLAARVELPRDVDPALDWQGPSAQPHRRMEPGLSPRGAFSGEHTLLLLDRSSSADPASPQDAETQDEEQEAGKGRRRRSVTQLRALLQQSGSSELKLTTAQSAEPDARVDEERQTVFDRLEELSPSRSPSALHCRPGSAEGSSAGGFSAGLELDTTVQGACGACQLPFSAPPGPGLLRLAAWRCRCLGAPGSPQGGGLTPRWGQRPGLRKWRRLAGSVEELLMSPSFLLTPRSGSKVIDGFRALLTIYPSGKGAMVKRKLTFSATVAPDVSAYLYSASIPLEEPALPSGPNEPEGAKRVCKAQRGARGDSGSRVEEEGARREGIPIAGEARVARSVEEGGEEGVGELELRTSRGRERSCLPQARVKAPAKGQVQLILLNPEGTPVHTFICPYDLQDMPGRTKTFVRQRYMRQLGAPDTKPAPEESQRTAGTLDVEPKNPSAPGMSMSGGVAPGTTDQQRQQESGRQRAQGQQPKRSPCQPGQLEFALQMKFLCLPPPKSHQHSRVATPAAAQKSVARKMMDQPRSDRPARDHPPTLVDSPRRRPSHVYGGQLGDSSSDPAQQGGRLFLYDNIRVVFLLRDSAAAENTKLVSRQEWPSGPQYFTL